MKVDNTKPLIESLDKGKSHGDLLNAFADIQQKREIHREELNQRLDEIDVEVKAELDDFANTTDSKIKAHISKKGPAHGETLETVHLEKKDNYPAGTVSQIRAGTPGVYVTPRGIQALLEDNLTVNPGDFITNGLIPISNYVTIGSSMAYDIYTNKEPNFPKENQVGAASYLLSTEKDFLLFSEFGRGRITNYSQGGDSAPTTTTRIQILENRLSIARGEAIGLNDITISDGFTSKATGLEFGFEQYRGNFYDSNFYPTVNDESAESTLVTGQNVEATLFNPTIVYKADGNRIIKNSNLTQHHFNRLLFSNAAMDLNNSSFLSYEDYTLAFFDTELIKDTNGISIKFYILAGKTGTPDWYPDEVTKNTPKILNKDAVFNPIKTMVTSISGYMGTGGGETPRDYVAFGVSENRNVFNRSNFTDSVYTGVIKIPISNLIPNFNDLPSNIQNQFIELVNKDLLKRITPCWSNKINGEGFIRVPLLFDVPNKDFCYSTYVDFSFTSDRTDSETYGIKISALNYKKSSLSNMNTDFTLVKEGKFKKFPKSVKDLPNHPLMLSGCFVETGGHIKVYSLGHRQYVCFYRHDVKSLTEWIGGDTELDTTDFVIKDISTMANNDWYGENVRFIPLVIDDNNITYLSYRRSNTGEYRNMLITLPNNADIEKVNGVKSLSKTLLSRDGYTNMPLLIENTSFSSKYMNIGGLVFSERNNFIGYNDPNWSGGGFNPQGKVILENNIRPYLRGTSGFIYPYELYFFYNGIIYGVFHAKEKRDDGSNNYIDVVVSACRANIVADETDFKISIIPTAKVKTIKSAIKKGEVDINEFGETHESFDDVFIIDKNSGTSTYDVFVNHPDLVGRYFTFSIELDQLGYYYPKDFFRQEINKLEENGYGKSVPYNFIKGNIGAICLKGGFYRQGVGVFDIVKHGPTGVTNINRYYMGYGTDLVLYLEGSTILINGKTKTIDKTISIPINGKEGGRVFVGEIDGEFIAYTEWNNPNGYNIEPDSKVVFCGYLYLDKDKWVFSKYADTSEVRLAKFDFLNSNMPVINNIQMSTDSLGSTFPMFLGKNKSKPKQFYFQRKN